MLKLKIDGLSCSIKSKEILKDITVSFQQGEMAAVTGGRHRGCSHIMFGSCAGGMEIQGHFKTGSEYLLILCSSDKSRRSHILFVGHAGVLLTGQMGFYFVEKSGLSGPYPAAFC